MSNLRYLLLSVVVVVVGYSVWIGMQDPQQIWLAVQKIGWSGVVFLCSLSLVNYFLRGLRWVWWLRTLGDRVPMVDGLLCFFAGFALTMTPAKAGEAIKCVYHKQRHAVDYSHTLAATIAERTCDLIAIGLIASLTLLHYPNLYYVGYALVALIFIALFLIRKPALLIAASEYFRAKKWPIVSNACASVPTLMERAKHLLSFNILLIGVLFGFVSWGAEAYGFAWAVQTTGLPAPTLVLASIFATSLLVGALSFIPGGIGTADATAYFLLIAVGVDSPTATAITLIYRVVTFWFAVLLGCLAMFWVSLSKSQELDDEHDQREIMTRSNN